MDKQPPNPDDINVTIEFPCDYPIKVVGDAADDFEAVVLDVIKRHAPDLDTNTVTRRDSKKGNFQSVSVVIVATGKPQLDKMFADLKAVSFVRMVL
ncbi:MAG: DUF493 domain-containing protein [Pseudomonadota bacterium]